MDILENWTEEYFGGSADVHHGQTQLGSLVEDLRKVGLNVVASRIDTARLNIGDGQTRIGKAVYPVIQAKDEQDWHDENDSKIERRMEAGRHGC